MKSLRGSILELVVAFLALAVAVAAHFLGATAGTVQLLIVGWGSVVLALVLLRWKPQIPLRAPWYRVLAISMLLLIVLAALQSTSSEAQISIDQEGESRATLLMFAVLVIPGVIGHELFFRGIVYSLIKRRRGVTAAVVVSAALPAAMLAPLALSPLPIFAMLISEGLLSASRAIAGSLAPALVAQVVLGAGAVSFVMLMIAS